MEVSRLIPLYVGVLLLLVATDVPANTRIVSLAPHLTEWVYSLEAEHQLVGVSAFSDYPTQAASKPIIADYQGVDFRALMALQPNLILAWGGGNKPQDIARLTTLGFDVFVSQPQTLNDIASELMQVAKRLNKAALGTQLTQQYRSELAAIKSQYQTLQPVPVFYYMWHQPIMTIGAGAWANQALSVCGAQSVFHDSPIDYPEVTLRQILSRKPALLIAATSQQEDTSNAIGRRHPALNTLPVIRADATALHRFSLRIVPAIHSLCERINRVRIAN